MSNVVRVESRARVASITLTRPERLNAIDLGTADALASAFRAVSANEDLRCVILRSSDARAFSVGADVSEFMTERYDPETARRYETRTRGMLDALRTCPHPVVAHIDGFCLGLGLALALTCDIQIGARTARLGLGASRTGHLIPARYLRLLAMLSGLSVARELVLEGRIYDAREALEKKLLTRIVPATELAGEVSATVARIVETAPKAARWHKAVLTAIASPGTVAIDEDEPFRAVGSQDYLEGVRAFMEKREPAFTGG